MKYIFRLVAIVASFVLLFAAYGGRVDPNIWSFPSLATLALPAVVVVVLILLALLVLLRCGGCDYWSTLLVMADNTVDISHQSVWPKGGP